MMKSDARQPVLHHRQTNEIVYDLSFETSTLRVYLFVPSEGDEKRYRAAFDLWGGAMGLTLDTFNFLGEMLRDYKTAKKTSARVETMYDRIIGAFVVAWEVIDEDQNILHNAANDKLDLEPAAKEEMSDKIIESLHLWFMTR